MFEDGKWQPLRPFYVYNDKHMKNFGLTESSFGPEIGFAHAIAEAWPNETIGIVKWDARGTGPSKQGTGEGQTTRPSANEVP